MPTTRPAVRARATGAIRVRAAVTVAAGCLLAASCGVSDAPPPSGSPTSGSPSTTPERVAATPTPASSATPGESAQASESPAASPSPTGPPEFSAKVSKVARDQLPYSWRPGCPVPVGDLRMVTMTHWGFDGKPHTGRLVVNKSVTDDVVTVFKRLYGWRWPIYKMVPVDVYKGDDYDSIDAGNTSAFNCRAATGSSNWSQHAYGRAIDLNPRENPYVYANGSVAHKNARKFAKRPLDEPGVINPGDKVVKAFQKLGWEWGGYWSGPKDLQHFSKGGG
ncbi:M15 family metallopeptidase [Streptosporangium pseudovulgare]|uniref:M15 family metallopeptidase n=1 Tax=Streptosporangium pseudovulgare TaxID=35765 RepID=UPI001E3A714B|nr:M15 family metallopeptidase [Streptosporangium pseudovulgare]